MPDLKTSVGKVRVIGMLEGISYLLLLGIAMPLKYIAGMPEAVKWTGWAHGALFVAYCLAILFSWIQRGLSFNRSLLAFIGSLIPFGPFLIDQKLAVDEEKELRSR